MRLARPLCAPRRRPGTLTVRGRDVRQGALEETWLAVSQIDDIWKINDEWWRGPDEEIERLYFSLTLENGQHVTCLP